MTERNYTSAPHLVEAFAVAKKGMISRGDIMDKKDNHSYPVENPPFPIPEYWEWAYLSDVSVIQEGPGIRKHQYQTEGIQFLTVTNILEGSVDLKKSQKYISEEEYDKKYQHFTINRGDIVTACSGASWGKSAIFNCSEKLMLNTSTLRLRFFNDLGVNSYLYYLTKSQYFKANLSSHSTGQQPNYGYSHYSKILIPIPPVQEQRRIASTLDQVFAAIGQAKANIEKNIENAKELLQAKLNEIFSQEGEGWEEKKLAEVCDLISGQHIASEDYNNDGEGVGYLTGPSDFGVLYPVVSKWTKVPKRVACKNDILITVKGSGVGSINLMNEEKLCISRQLMAIRCKEVETDFLYSFLTIQYKYFQSLSNGAAIPGISRSDVLGLKLSIPQPDVQRDYIQRIGNFRDYSNQLIEKNNAKLLLLEELEKSVLQKAFAGELTQKEVEV